MRAGGESFGSYRLLRRIAVGGMAEIFLAAMDRDPRFEKKVVVKRILPQFNADPSFVQMFIDEAVVAGRLSHPNIAQVYDFGQVEGVYYMALEYIDGADLRQVLQASDEQRRAFTFPEVAAIGEGVARGLAYAHAFTDERLGPLHIVHRDISPHNIMLSRAGDVKVMDFGIAKAAARSTRTAAGTLKGKVAYMAPEQAAGREIDGRCDQFALGVVLWECLSGRRLFEGNSDLELLQRILACSVRPLREARGDVPTALEAVVMRCLDADPAARYADMREVEQALADFRFSLGSGGLVKLGGLVDAVVPPVAPAAAPAKQRRTRALTDIEGAAGQSDPNDTAGRDASGRARGKRQSAPALRGSEPTVLAAGPLIDESEAETGPLPTVRPHARESLTTAEHGPVVHTGSGRIPLDTLRYPAVRHPAQPAGYERRERAGRRSLGVVLAVTAVLLAVAAGGWLLLRSHSELRRAERSSAHLRIETEPVGARVFVDGVDSGLLTPAPLPAKSDGGSFELELRREGYEPWRQHVSAVTEGDLLRAHLTPSVPAAPAGAAGAGAISAGAPPQAVAVPAAAAVISNTAGAPGVASSGIVPIAESQPEPAAHNPHSKRGGPGARSSAPAKAVESTRDAAGGREGATEQGWISLRAIGTWVDVYLDERHLGTTPLEHVPVPSGTLRLHIVNAEKGIDRFIQMQVPPQGEAKHTFTP